MSYIKLLDTQMLLVADPPLCTYIAGCTVLVMLSHVYVTLNCGKLSTFGKNVGPIYILLRKSCYF